MEAFVNNSEAASKVRDVNISEELTKHSYLYMFKIYHLIYADIGYLNASLVHGIPTTAPLMERCCFLAALLLLTCYVYTVITRTITC